MIRILPLTFLPLLGCPVPDPDPGPPTTQEAAWTAAFDTSTSGALSGVWGSSPSDVFVVGGSERGGEAYHYDGATWAEMEVPAGLGLLVWVYGFGPNDVYTVGVDGSAAHWNGDVWTALDTGTEEDLWGVFGFSPDDLWIVGGDPDVGDPLILHYDGESFEEVPVDPGQNSRGATTLFKVWGIGETLFAVGQRGLVLRWDGDAWTEVPAGANADQDFVSLWGTSEDNIVAVGGRGNGRVASWDGQSWTTIKPSGRGGINAVFMDEPDMAVIGGIYGFVGTFDPTTANLTDEGPATALDIHAIWGDGEGTYYGVGGRFREPYEGVAFVRSAP